MMHKLIIVVLTAVMGFHLGPAQDETINKLEKAISEGNVTQLMEQLDQQTEVVTPYADGVYSKNQAAQLLKTFFAKHPCESFAIGHRGNSAGGAIFVIGTYTSRAEEYRVNIFLQQKGRQFLIQGISFEN